jgi:anti-sigma factor RsiW
MTCERIEELLSAYLEGDLTGAEKREVEAHLAGCPSCAELLSFLRETQDAFSAFPEIEPSPALMKKLYAVPEKKRFFKPIVRFLLKPDLQPVYAAFSVLFLALSFVFFTPQGSGIRKEVDRRLHQGYSQVEKLYAEAGSLTDEMGSLTTSVVDSIKTLNPLKGQEEKK